MDEDLADALRREDASAFARFARQSRGFRSFAEHALEYALQGITSIEEVIRVAGTIEEVQDEFTPDEDDGLTALAN
jgi:MSHA biogenesis protein MshE